MTMQAWNNFSKLSVWFVLCGIATSCASISLEPGTEKINVATGSPPKTCQFRGNVNSGTAGAPITSHSHIQETQIAMLKNQAVKLDANVIFLTTHKTTFYPQFIAAASDWVSELDTHTMSGKAYYCNSQALNQINKKIPSDVRSREQ
jgi:hypothetical protein